MNEGKNKTVLTIGRYLNFKQQISQVLQSIGLSWAIGYIPTQIGLRSSFRVRQKGNF